MNTPSQPHRREALRSVAMLATVAALPALATAQDGGAWLIVSHRVQDFAAWKSVFDSVATMKRAFGWKQSTIYAIDGDRNHVLVLEEFGSMERAKAFASSPDLKAAMGKAGVMGPPDIRFVQSLAHAKA